MRDEPMTQKQYEYFLNNYRTQLWEYIGLQTHRLKVPGGWLIRTFNSVGNSIGPGTGTSVSIIYLKTDENWELPVPTGVS